MALFEKGKSGNPGGISVKQREAREKLRQALAKDADEVHAALMDLVRERNQPTVVYAHQVLHGKEPERLDVKHDVENPATPLTTEQLLEIAKAVKT